MLEQLRQTFTDNWIAWAYQYGVGGAFFWVTLLLGARSGSLDLRTRAGKRLLVGLVGGYFLFAGIHAAWISGVQGPPGAINQAELLRRTPAAGPGGGTPAAARAPAADPAAGD